MSLHLVFIGGTRFIGHAACLRAFERGHRVTVLHRGRTPSELPFAREVVVDRNDPSALARAVAKAKPDVVIDTRAMTRSEAEASALAIDAAHVPAVVLSSQDVYAQFGRLNGLPAPPPEDVVTEDSPLTVPKPFASLGVPHEGGDDYDKKDVERVFRELSERSGLASTMLRLPGVYGPRDPKRRFGAVVDALREGEDLPCARGRSLRLTHVHVGDVAHAIVLTAERIREGHRAFNVGEEITPTMRERSALIASVMGKTVRFRETDDELPPALSLFGSFPNDCVMSSARIRAELGFAELEDPRARTLDLVRALEVGPQP